MVLNSLRLQGFRAHQESNLSFAPKVNLLHGPNGAGKTNILEAVHYLCLTKSFAVSKDRYVLRKGAPFFEIEGTFEGEQRSSLTIRIAFVPNEGKRAFVNGAPVDRLADLVGQVPVVAFTPADQAITAGGPEERRKFVNTILSQAHKVYLDDMLKYRRALRQRNALLLQCKRTRSTGGATLEAWTDELVLLGSRIVEARIRFLDEFKDYLARAHALIEEVAEKPTIRYQSVVSKAERTGEEIASAFRDRLGRNRRRELELGRTLAGPHRDDLVFRLNDLEVRRYASQGQHRTFGMALKLATYTYLYEHLDEHPLLLLDDVFGDLDTRRANVFLNLLRTEAVGQSLLTAAEERTFTEVIPFAEPQHRSIEVRGGRVLEPDPKGTASPGVTE